MAITTFPSDTQRGIPNYLTKLGSLLLRARYRTSVGDSNAANKTPLIIQAAPSQSADLVDVYDSAKNGLFWVDKDGKAHGAAGTDASSYTTIDGVQTLTNKSLTSPTITGTPSYPAGQMTQAGLDPTVIQYATVPVSSAELLALFTTAKQLVAAPGAGKVIEFIRATITYTHVATDYTINGSTNLSVKYKDKTGADVSSTRATTGFIDQAGGAYSMFQPLTAQLALDANAVNQPLCLALLVANPTLGDGTLKVNVVYRVHTL